MTSQQLSKRNIKPFWVKCFGAASEVGRSCIMVKMSGATILLDSGINMGTTDSSERTPKLPKNVNVDFVIVSHIHSDHLASLPWLTEVLKIQVPIIMTRASFELAPIMLQDFIKVSRSTPDMKQLFNTADMEACLKHVKCVDFYQRIQVIPDFYVTVFPAGHLLGAGAFYIQGRGRSLLYTGDFSGAADHHLPGQQIPRLFPDLLITESTYGSSTRDPMYKRERNFVQMVHRCVADGGKVIIPVFAVGRLQEVCLMLNDYWERMDLRVPIYFSSKMGGMANEVYKRSIQWMNPTVKTNFYDNGATFLNLTRVKQYFQNQVSLDNIGPCVMVATAGMLNIGLSFDCFVKHKWCEDPKNMIIFPGYCSPGTLGRMVLEREGDEPIKYVGRDNVEYIVNVRCQVARVSFSAHADQFEILSMAKRLQPKAAITVHGEPESVTILRDRIADELKIPAWAPTLLEKIDLPYSYMKPVHIARECIEFDEDQPVSFTGAVVKEEGAPLKIVPFSSKSAKRVRFTRNLRLSSCSRERLQEVLINMGLIEGELPDENVIVTDAFSLELVENGLKIRFDYSNKNVVNEFCTLILDFPQ